MARHAQILHAGRRLAVTVGDDDVLVAADGRTFNAGDVIWLPPAGGTMIALGLNYADHASELAFKAPPEEPLLFIKTRAALTGHLQVSCRPDHVEYMHYEGELVVVIGRTARRVSRAAAADYIGGYTICNDYAVRDYLENYYRPNLRVKCRAGLTPVGPWIVDPQDIENPANLEIRTTVNGICHQRGNTRDMIFDVPHLIEYLSSFMTLSPGDMIATGTPKGLADVRPGDEVAVEIDGIGRLVNTIVSEETYLARNPDET